VVPDRQQVNGGVETCVQQQVVRHHVFAYLAIFGNGLELAFQLVDTVAGLHRAGGALKEQPPQSGKALQVRNDGVGEFVQQGIKRVRRFGFASRNASPTPEGCARSWR
jgi:hypothetical protein